MKKIFILLLIFPFYSFAGESIKEFNVEVRVNKDSSINVTEKINYDFDNLKSGKELHGLYRDIPYKYRSEWGGYNFEFSDVLVNTENFEFYKYSDKYLRIDTNPDPDIHVKGVVPYVFNYKVIGAIGYFEDFDEIYWNTTGDEWGVPIGRPNASVFLPEPISKNSLKVSCYEGRRGSTEKCEYIMVVKNGLVEEIRFMASRDLVAGEGMTVAIGFPKGLVYEPTRIEKVKKIFWDNKIYLLPVFTFFMMLYLWHIRGRDPNGTGIIIPQYDVPHRLTPMELALIYRNKVKVKLVSSEIINLAIKGYIKIEKIDKKWFLGSEDYLFKRTEKTEKSIKDHEIAILDSIFGSGLGKEGYKEGLVIQNKSEVKLSSLKDNFLSHLIKVMKILSKSVVDGGFYDKDPERVRNNYIFISILMFFASIMLSEFMGVNFSLSLITSALIVFVFSFFMSKRTQKGVEAYEYILGLKEYLQIAERDRINFHNAPEKKPEIFEKFLPYAMVLGVEKAWAKEFEGVYTNPPSWYNDGQFGTFNAIAFTNSLNSFGSMAGSSLTSAPGGSSGSGGGGSSGGGGGGGGGGSH